MPFVTEALLEDIVGEIGKETGLMEKRLHEQMQQHVERESGMLRTLIGIERRHLEGLIETQRQTIESQSRRIAVLESRIATPRRKEANVLPIARRV